MKNRWVLIVATGVLSTSSAMFAQSAPVSTTPASSATGPEPQSAPAGLRPMLAVLDTTIDAKKAKVGDVVNAHLLSEVKVGKKVVLHHGAKLIGHVTLVQAHTKEHPESMLAITFDKGVGKGPEEMTLHATIQALAALQPPPMSPVSDDDDLPAFWVPTPTSKGVFRLPGLSLRAPADDPQVTVVFSSTRNVQLDDGTWMVLQIKPVP